MRKYNINNDLNHLSNHGNKTITEERNQNNNERETHGKTRKAKGNQKKRHFDETKLGFFLKYEAPIEYELIMASTPKGVFPEPTMKIIEAITLASPNPVFQKNKFYRYMDEYKTNKLCTSKPKRMTPVKKEYYERLQSNQMKRYIEQRKKTDTFFS